MRMEDFTGTGKLVRLIVRRDRMLLAIWVILIVFLAILIAKSMMSLYPTAEMIKAFADGVNSSPGEYALLGKILAPTIGGLVSWRASAPIFVCGGLASLLALIKYTRTEEETGRLELVSSGAIGKYAGLSAAYVVVFAVNAVIAALVILGLLAIGLPVAGSVALGLAIAAAGCLFTGVAGVVAQVAGSTGPARGITGGILGLAFIVNIMANVSDMQWITWLTPSGWMQRVQPFAGDHWWVLLLFGITAVVLVAISFMLSSGRDLGAGLMPEKSGPSRASLGLRSPLALAWRLQRGTLFAWIAFCIFAGSVFGYIGKTVSDQLIANPGFAEVLAHLGGNAMPADSLFTMVLMIIGEIVTVYAIMAVLKMQSEETDMHAEALLATPVSRLQWAAGHLAIAILGTAAILITFGLCAGLTYGLSAGNVGSELPRMLISALAYLPAIWVIAGIAVALYGLLPRFTILAWGALVVCLLVDLLREFRIASGTILNVSPFVDVPKLLVTNESALPLFGLAVIVAALVAAGLFGLRRRSIG